MTGVLNPEGADVRPGKLLVWLAAGGVACAVAMLFLFDPANARVFPPCPFHAATGLHCPGCGSLRGLHRLLQGDVVGAIDSNVLMVMSLPFAAWWGVRGFTAAVFGLKWRRVFLRAGWIWGILWVIVAFGVLRNVPFYPFTALAP